MEVHSAGLISDQVALRELQFSARRTGRWKAITDEIVEAADEVAPAGEDVVEPPRLPDDSQQSDSSVDGLRKPENHPN